MKGKRWNLKWFDNVSMFTEFKGYMRLRLRLGPMVVSAFAFFFFFSRVLVLLWLLFMHCAWTVAAKFNLSNNFQPISAHRALSTDPQISLFCNFFIKNRSHDTIHIFKNYFATVFFNFQLYPNGPSFSSL